MTSNLLVDTRRALALSSVALLAACGSPVVDGPAVADWTPVERAYVERLRETEPFGRFPDDAAAVPWISAGYAACAAISEDEYLDGVVSAAERQLDGDRFGPYDAVAAAHTLCPENLERARYLSTSQEVF